MTNDKTVSEIIGETAANRDRAIAEAEAKRRAMWARIPRLAELDGVLSRTGSRIMAAAAAGGDVAARVAEIERENERLHAERAQLFPVAVPQPAVADDDRHAGGGKQLDDRHIAHSRADEADARGGVGLNVFLQHKTLSMRT